MPDSDSRSALGLDLDLPASEWAGLTKRLAQLDGPADNQGEWSEPLWEELRASGATRWGLPGSEVPRVEALARYLRIAEGSLTAALALTQHDGAIRRLASSSAPAAQRWLAGVAQGTAFPTIGISQLTTSQRLGPKALGATPLENGAWRLDGAMPWVTAASRADAIVTGAIDDQGRQLLIVMPTRAAGVRIEADLPLAALQASSTAMVACADVRIEPDEILAGPAPNVMAGSTGGLETSALALGQARAVLIALGERADSNPDLTEIAQAQAQAWRSIWGQLAALAQTDGPPDPEEAAKIRHQANELAFQSARAFLLARKGSGLLKSDPAQRWARQALFFQVWSCPASVAKATLGSLSDCGFLT